MITYLDLVSSDISFDTIDIIEASNHLSIVWFGASVVVLVEEYKKNITNLSPYIIIKDNRMRMNKAILEKIIFPERVICPINGIALRL